MKKVIVIVGSLLTALTAMSYAVASPNDSVIRFECPNASGGLPSERLTNYGTSISGMGEENVDGTKVAKPVFRGIPSSGVPINLATGAYCHAGTLYNEHSGRVTCLFVSSNGSDPFDVSFEAENVKHGYVTKSSNNKITVNIPQGLK